MAALQSIVFIGGFLRGGKKQQAARSQNPIGPQGAVIIDDASEKINGPEMGRATR
jgi:hypothetical protein